MTHIMYGDGEIIKKKIPSTFRGFCGANFLPSPEQIDFADSFVASSLLILPPFTDYSAPRGEFSFREFENNRARGACRVNLREKFVGKAKTKKTTSRHISDATCPSSPGRLVINQYHGTIASFRDSFSSFQDVLMVGEGILRKNFIRVCYFLWCLGRMKSSLW